MASKEDARKITPPEKDSIEYTKISGKKRISWILYSIMN